MRSILFVLALVAAPAAYADIALTCSNDGGSISYLPNQLKFKLADQAAAVDIVGTPEPLPSEDDERSVFSYVLDNGQTVKITWVSAETEVLRNIRARAEKTELLNAHGQTLEVYSHCHWE